MVVSTKGLYRHLGSPTVYIYDASVSGHSSSWHHSESFSIQCEPFLTELITLMPTLVPCPKMGHITQEKMLVLDSCLFPLNNSP